MSSESMSRYALALGMEFLPIEVSLHRLDHETGEAGQGRAGLQIACSLSSASIQAFASISKCQAKRRAEQAICQTIYLEFLELITLHSTERSSKAKADMRSVVPSILARLRRF